MIARSKNDIATLREGGALLAHVLQKIIKSVRPGIQTSSLDEIAKKEILAVGGEPSFLNYKSHSAKTHYPAALCVSINDEIVHGIPGERVLKEGDIVGLDIGMKYKDFFTDMAVTVPVGKVSQEAEKLMRVTKKALDIGIDAVHAGARTGDIGEAIQSYVESEGLQVVRELVGHGVGKAVHEEPEIPNWGKRGIGPELREGEVVALEPMIVFGSPRIKVSRDGWAWSTQDGSLSAHFEHTILVTKKGAEILTR